MLKQLIVGSALALGLVAALNAAFAAGGGGTVCGSQICNTHEICCVKDPLPPAPATYTCIPKNQTCPA